MVTIPDGAWVDNATNAVELRNALGAVTILPSGSTGTRAGRLPGPANPLRVEPTTPATMAVLVRAGKGVTYRGASYGPVLGLGPDGDVTVPIPAAPATGSQWHRVYLLQRDTTAPANDATGGAVVDVVSGVAASSPVAPTIPAGALLLGDVVVPAGASTVTSAYVTDKPTWTAPRGGILPTINAAETAGLTGFATREVLELDKGRRLFHDGTRWRYPGDRVVVADANERLALSAYLGLEVLQLDTGREWHYRTVGGSPQWTWPAASQGVLARVEFGSTVPLSNSAGVLTAFNLTVGEIPPYRRIARRFTGSVMPSAGASGWGTILDLNGFASKRGVVHASVANQPLAIELSKIVETTTARTNVTGSITAGAFGGTATWQLVGGGLEGPCEYVIEDVGTA